MANHWLNRFGILLNFIAGFLIAPELIGIKRLKKFEQRLEKILTTIVSKLTNWLKKFTTREAGLAILGLVLFLAFSYFFFIAPLLKAVSEWGFITLLILFYTKVLPNPIGLAIILLVCLPTAIGVINSDLNGRKWTISNLKPNLLKYSLMFIGSIFFFPLSLILSIPLIALIGVLTLVIFISYLIIILLLPIFRFILHKLEGNNRLKSLLVFLGIIMYIIGNLLQLITS